VPDLRVLVLGLDADPESFVLRTLEGLVASGTSVAVATRRDPTEAASGDIEWLADPRAGGGAVASRVLERIRSVGRGPVRRPERVGLTSARLADDFDLIYLPWLNTAVERPEVFDLGVPVAVSCRGSFVAVAPWNPRRAAFRDALRPTFHRAAGVHCVSRSMVRDAEPFGLDADRATVVYTGVDTDLYRPEPDRDLAASDARAELRILWVGGLNWKKDIEHALLAVAQLDRAGRTCSMSIVGSGDELDRARFTIDDLGLGARIRLMGQVAQRDLPALHRAHDVLLHSASTEGVPNVVVEAMASGLPVVVTDAGGSGEAVTDGVEGFLVPVRSPDRMAERLVELATDARLRGEMGHAGRRRALAQFDLDHHVVEFRHFLEVAAGSVTPSRSG
jgi:colanic acid/amylovoran biosynthesis glycosyltransferase